MYANPWRQICALRIHAKNGSAYVGTGWFIASKVLVTAGHCVFMHKQGGWPKSIDVIPAKFGGTEPYGRTTATRFASVDGWLTEAGRDFDYGVIFLDDPALGERLGNFEVEVTPDEELARITARISGYPADRDRAEYQYYHERPLQSVSPSQLLYDIDTYGGQSGSPVWRQAEGSPAVAIGIHTTGGLTSNSATRISDPVFDNLILWSEERPHNEEHTSSH
jgi:V8-like Glu-specific endopeptidase